MSSQQQRQDQDLQTLQDLFGAPWTPELLKSVYLHHDEDMNETQRCLTVLNSHHKGNPKPLVDKLVQSRSEKKLPKLDPNSIPFSIAEPSLRKKAPEPQKVTLTVENNSNSNQLSKITIQKQVRPRRGIPMTLPDDFLRLPRGWTAQQQQEFLLAEQQRQQQQFVANAGPLFAPDHLDHLKDMPGPGVQQQQQPTASTTFGGLSFASPFTRKSNETTSTNTSTGEQTARMMEGSKKMLEKMSVMSSSAKQSFLAAKTPTFTMPKITPPNSSGSSIFGGRASPTMSNNKNNNDNNLLSTGSLSNIRTTPETQPNQGDLTTALQPPADHTGAKPRWSLPHLNVGEMNMNMNMNVSLPTMPKNMNVSLPTMNVTESMGSMMRKSFPGSPMASSTQLSATAAPTSPPAPAAPLPPVAIPQVEYRGITLKQLQYLVRTMESKCRAEQWKCTTTDIQAVEKPILLAPEDVTMYDLIHYHIRPLCVSNNNGGCSYAEWAAGQHHHLHSSSVVPPPIPSPQPRPQWFVTHWWGQSVTQLVKCLEQHAFDHGYENGTTSYWIAALALDPESYVVPTTNSNATGEDLGVKSEDGLDDFLGLPPSGEDKASKSTSDTGAATDSTAENALITNACSKVLQVTQGLLAVIDPESTCSTRLWCNWEWFLALKRDVNFEQSEQTTSPDAIHSFLEHDHNKGRDLRYWFDVYSIGKDGVPVGLTDGAVAADTFPAKRVAKREDFSSPFATATLIKKNTVEQVDWSEHRTRRQESFPFETCLKALESLYLEDAHTSCEDDKKRILNHIVHNYERVAFEDGDTGNSSVTSSLAEPVSAHVAYDDANALLRGKFAATIYRHTVDAAGRGKDEVQQNTLKVIRSLLVAAPLRRLEMNFAGCKAFQGAEVLEFMASLPTSLRNLELDYSFLGFKTSDEFAVGLSRLGDNLQSLRLNLAFCGDLGNLDKLWEELGGLKKLQKLCLVIHPNKNLTSIDGLATAVAKLQELRKLELEFDCFGHYTLMVAKAKGGATMNNLSINFRSLVGVPADATSPKAITPSLNFDKISNMANLDLTGKYVADCSILGLCRTLTARIFDSKLTDIKLRFIGDLGKKLKPIKTMDELHQFFHRMDSENNSDNLL